MGKNSRSKIRCHRLRQGKKKARIKARAEAKKKG